MPTKTATSLHKSRGAAGDVDTRTVSPGEVTEFPQPRLETDERSEINDFRRRKKALHSTDG